MWEENEDTKVNIFSGYWTLDLFVICLQFINFEPVRTIKWYMLP